VSELNAAEDQNLNDFCIMKTIKCHQLNLMSGVLSIILYIPDIDPEELKKVLK
jgi:hypothetical protein